jgi:hypothetical protein
MSPRRRRRGAALALVVAAAGLAAAWAFVLDPAGPAGPPFAATVVEVREGARAGQEPVAGAPTVVWTVETADGRRLSGRALAEVVPEEGAEVCVQRTERERSGEAGLRLVARGPCP